MDAFAVFDKNMSASIKTSKGRGANIQRRSRRCEFLDVACRHYFFGAVSAWVSPSGEDEIADELEPLGP